MNNLTTLLLNQGAALCVSLIILSGGMYSSQKTQTPFFAWITDMLFCLGILTGIAWLALSLYPPS